MKLSISNIAWTAEQDLQMSTKLNNLSFVGLEIAPTRIFVKNPYDDLVQAHNWSLNLEEQNGLSISSMQSIWYGRQEKLFGTVEERVTLLDYTKKAIDFASAIDCKNLVFGCPRNRNMPDNCDESVAIEFFKEIGDYAYEHNTVIGMEANPPMYNTNYINTTKSAIELIHNVNSQGFKLNLDVGTMLANGEDVSLLEGNVNLINHVHISEPGLKTIEKRKLHQELYNLLLKENYQNFISIEMGKQDDIAIIEKAMTYVKSIFG